MTEYAKFYEASQQLLVLHGVLEDEIGESFQTLLGLLAQPTPDLPALSRAYVGLFRLLTQEAGLYRGGAVGDAWQNHLLDRLLDSDGVVVQRMRYSPSSKEARPGETIEVDLARAQVFLGNGLMNAVNYDLKRLQSLYSLNVTKLALKVRELLNDPDLPGWSGFYSVRGDGDKGDEAIRSGVKRRLANSPDWPAQLGLLAGYYRYYDPSDFRRYRAFRWLREGRGGRLEPMRYLDDQRLENLVGYERERRTVVANTEQFLAGLGANHVLLYGARGTGKSSTVKALLPRYAEQGLRLIEVHKSELGDYALIAEMIRERPEKFILFVDDLSFEADETGYKELKALLEGSLEARPANLLIYATSNRRHLIKEQFGDNARLGDEEINAWDTVEEKLSLSDRFGLLITFLAPNQQQYLAIVDSLARGAGIELESEDLHRRALRWEMSHSGRSGRTARQFVDQLAGELQLNQPNQNV